MFDKDPLPFEGRLELWWRNGGPKCGLPRPDLPPDVGNTVVTRDYKTVVPGHDENSNQAPILPGPNRVHSLVWYYTWSSA